MATLHLVNKPAAWEACRPLLDAEDAVLLIEDGTYLAQQALSGATLYALEPDIR
ncbi:MAG: sulfurtransferase complex subunit TusB, partial [Gammaproteobacteria bacterium]|nr:sulfurtransferase complex subunit TusB [Gammaproteobacteria bacterium]